MPSRVVCVCLLVIVWCSAEASQPFAKPCASAPMAVLTEARRVAAAAILGLRSADSASNPGSLASMTADDVLRSPQRRVRALPRRLRGLPAEAFRRSPTFAGLLLALQGSDVIVHLHDSPYPLEIRPAQLVMGPRVGQFRFVRIQVGNRPLGDDLIAVIGHELFHALEIAASPEVTKHADLGSLFRRIGYRTSGADEHFDSDGARAAERRIRTELATACR